MRFLMLIRCRRFVAATAIPLASLLVGLAATGPAFAQGQVVLISADPNGQIQQNSADISGGEATITSQESYTSDGPGVESGGTAIVRTKVDPVVTLDRTILNRSDTLLDSFAFSLPNSQAVGGGPVPDLFFYNAGSVPSVPNYGPFSDRFRQFRFDEPVGQNGFLTLIFFDPLPLLGPVATGQTMNFRFVLNVPAPQPGFEIDYSLDSRPGTGSTPGTFSGLAPRNSNFVIIRQAVIPEPSTVVLLASGALPLLAGAFAGRRRRAARRGRDDDRRVRGTGPAV